MPKFNKIHFGNVYFGTSTPPTANWKRSFANIPLGIRVRRRFGHEVIFRVRRGSGHAGSIKGKLYQDKYKYVVPSSINNPESDSVRLLFATAVSNWQSVLTAEQKTAYNTRANKGLHMSGYNLYIREYIKANL